MHDDNTELFTAVLDHVSGGWCATPPGGPGTPRPTLPIWPKLPLPIPRPMPTFPPPSRL